MDASPLSEPMETTRQRKMAELMREQADFENLLARGEHRTAVANFRKAIELACEPSLGLGIHDYHILHARELVAKAVAAYIGKHQAITEYETLLQLREDAHGAGSPLTCATRQELAHLLWRDKEESADSGARASDLIVQNLRAKVFRVQALEKVKDIKLISEVLSWLWIKSLDNIEDLEDARSWLHDILRLREEEYGPRNPITEVPRRKYAAVLLKLGERCGVNGSHASSAQRYFQEAKKLATHNTDILADAKVGNDRRIKENKDLIKRSVEAEQRMVKPALPEAEVQSGVGANGFHHSLSRSQTLNEETFSPAHEVRPASPLPEIRTGSPLTKTTPRVPPPLPPRNPREPGNSGSDKNDPAPSSHRYPIAASAENVSKTKLDIPLRHGRHHHRRSTGPRERPPQHAGPSQNWQGSVVNNLDTPFHEPAGKFPDTSRPWTSHDALARHEGLVPDDTLYLPPKDFRPAWTLSETHEYNEVVLKQIAETTSHSAAQFLDSNTSSPQLEARRLSSATSTSALDPQMASGIPAKRGLSSPVNPLMNPGESLLAGSGRRETISTHFLKLAKYTNDPKKHKRAQWLDNHREYNLLEDLSQTNRESAQYADEWFFNEERLQSVHSILDQQSKRRDPNDTTPRVKVCILDTGFDGRHPFLLDPPFGKGLGRRIKGYIGFDDDGNLIEEKRAWSEWKDDPQALTSNTYIDWDGHGTHCAGVVLQVAPEADIYIARIGRGRFDDLDTSLVPKAIEYAATEWKVDIMSMSWGIDDDSSFRITPAIQDCAYKIAIFAAASNHGATGDTIAFPANLASVICVKSANGKGTFSADISPRNTKDAGENFTALGEMVLSLYPQYDLENGITVFQKRCSGTSMATPNAAGIAANILEFTRQADDQGPIRYLSDCRKIIERNPSASIRRIMRDTMTVDDGGALFLAPWLLFKSDPDAKPSDREIAARKIYQCLNPSMRPLH